MPFFSVIICTFNRAHLLPRALDSLLNQTEDDWEAIIVNDASTDDTRKVIQTYVDRNRGLEEAKNRGGEDSRTRENLNGKIREIEEVKNRGTAGARNVGIKNATGTWITFLDSDDAYEPDHLEVRKHLLQSNDSLQMLIGGCRVVGDPWVIDMNDKDRYVHVDECVIGGTFFIRRDVFDLIGYFPEGVYADDTLFYEKAAAFGIVLARTNVRSYVYHRDGHEQITKRIGD